MRYLLGIALSVLLYSPVWAHDDVNIGIYVNAYPGLVRVPGYPVYYDPRGDSNYFFYDGLYWVFQRDNWYQSAWYNGPWYVVRPQYVPVYVLRVPVRYYRRPPQYFHGWRADAPPRWGEHWGRDWEQQRSGWNQWNRHSAPRPAPLPSYQRNYSGDRYPVVPQQQYVIRSEKYRYQPHEALTKQQWQQAAEPEKPGHGHGHGDADANRGHGDDKHD